MKSNYTLLCKHFNPSLDWLMNHKLHKLQIRWQQLNFLKSVVQRVPVSEILLCMLEDPSYMNITRKEISYFIMVIMETRFLWYLTEMWLWWYPKDNRRSYKREITLLNPILKKTGISYGKAKKRSSRLIWRLCWLRDKIHGLLLECTLKVEFVCIIK